MRPVPQVCGTLSAGLIRSMMFYSRLAAPASPSLTCPRHFLRTEERPTLTSRLSSLLARSARRRAGAFPDPRHIAQGRLTYVALVCCFLAAIPALAQPRPVDPASDVALARYAPSSARLFVSIRRPARADDALDRANVRRLLPLLAGAAVEDGKPFDLRKAFMSFLGAPASVNIDALMQTETAFVAPSWSELGGGLWLVRLPHETALNQWFPPSQRLGGGTVGAASFFRSRSGVTVCRRGGIVAMARQGGPDSLLHQTMSLLAGRENESLEKSPGFKDLMAYLPPNYLAVAYLAMDNKSVSSGVKESPWLPAVDRAVIGLYEGEGRIDVAIRASLAAPHRKPRMAARAIERFFQLPQTTLLASATTIDFDRAVKAATATSSTRTLEGYLRMLATIARSSDGAGTDWSHLGPHVILAWGQDLREGASAPQVAVMVECTDGRAVRDRVRQIAEKLIELAHTIDPANNSAALTIHQTRHLGASIMHIPLRAYARDSTLPFSRLLANIDPAWTVWHGWLIVALSRDHIERILDAQFGLAPTLAAAPDVRNLRKRERDRTVIAFAQAGLATDVLDRWLSAFDTGAVSLLDPAWWQWQAPPARRRKLLLGIGMKVAHPPGVVAVARVYPKTAATGRLQPGDQILGIDGHLLSLTSPNGDFRKRWIDSTAQPGPTLRVQRNGTAIDVVLPKKKEDAPLSSIRVNPADAVRELASVGRTLQFISFAVNASDDMHYSARLSLRFAPEHVSNASTDR